MKRVTIVLLLFFSLCSLLSADNGRLTIAILDFSAIGVESTTARAVNENLITQVIKLQKFNVVERSQLKKVLGELNLANTEDFSDENAQEIGVLVGANIVVVGSVTQLGQLITINVRGIEVSSGIAMFAEDKSTRNINQLYKMVNDLAVQMGKTFKYEEIVEEEAIVEESESKAETEEIAEVEESDKKEKPVKKREKIKREKISIKSANFKEYYDNHRLFPAGVAFLGSGFLLASAGISMMVAPYVDTYYIQYPAYQAATDPARINELHTNLESAYTALPYIFYSGVGLLVTGTIMMGLSPLFFLLPYSGGGGKVALSLSFRGTTIYGGVIIRL